MNNNISVFLSHSHKDIERVRKIRDLLELINCEPIVFYLKCLDDDNEQLEDFIKKEIDARNIFLYCKSQNAENSIWVKKELEYIKSTNSSRLYSIDIDNSFEIGLISFLEDLIKLFNNNSLIIYHSKADEEIAHSLGNYLIQANFRVFYHVPELYGVPSSMKTMSVWEYNKYHDMYASFFDNEVVPEYQKLCKNGILIPIISDFLMDGDWSSYIAGKSINWFKQQKNYKIFPVTTDKQKSEKMKLTYLTHTDKAFELILQKIINISKS